MKYRMRQFSICSVLALGLLGTSDLLQAQDSSYQATTDKFFDMLQQGKAADAIDYVLGTNPLLKKMPDQAENLKAQFAALGTLAGSYISHAKLAETKVADMFVYQHYFVAYDRQPISVRIKYYKPGTAWLCYGLQFDANLPDLIQRQVDERLPIDGK
jgi:hypothetical protein